MPLPHQLFQVGLVPWGKAPWYPLAYSLYLREVDDEWHKLYAKFKEESNPINISIDFVGVWYELTCYGGYLAHTPLIQPAGIPFLQWVMSSLAPSLFQDQTRPFESLGRLWRFMIAGRTCTQCSLRYVGPGQVMYTYTHLIAITLTLFRGISL